MNQTDIHYYRRIIRAQQSGRLDDDQGGRQPETRNLYRTEIHQAFEAMATLTANVQSSGQWPLTEEDAMVLQAIATMANQVAAPLTRIRWAQSGDNAARLQSRPTAPPH